MGKIKVTDREGKLHELEADVGSTIMEIHGPIWIRKGPYG